jgi:hypothetical protein
VKNALCWVRGGLEQELLPGGSVDRGPRVDLGRKAEAPGALATRGSGGAL